MSESILDRCGLRPGRFRLLLITLLAYCVGIAIFPDVEAAGVVLGVSLLAATVLELQGAERLLIRRTIVIVAVLAAATRIVGLFFEVNDLPLVSNTFDIIFAGGMTFAVYSAIRSPNRAAGDRVVGAICVYLLIGFAWAAIYSTIESVSPGSFRVPGDVPPDTASTAFVYFSFVTLSTLGYGDITPVTRLAGTFAWMEAIVGQLFIAITVAGLISLALAEKRSTGDDNG